MIEIIINGEPRQVEPGLTLDLLLERLELPTTRIAVEKNQRVVPRERFALEGIRPGDRLEIVTLVGGG